MGLLGVRAQKFAPLLLGILFIYSVTAPLWAGPRLSPEEKARLSRRAEADAREAERRSERSDDGQDGRSKSGSVDAPDKVLSKEEHSYKDETAPPSNCDARLAELAQELRKAELADWAAEVNAHIASMNGVPVPLESWIGAFQRRSFVQDEKFQKRQAAMNQIVEMFRIAEFRRLKNVLSPELREFSWVLAQPMDEDLIQEFLLAITAKSDFSSVSRRMELMDKLWKEFPSQRERWKFSREEDGDVILYRLNLWTVLSDPDGRYFLKRGSFSKDLDGFYKTTDSKSFPAK